jgi:quercetin dioxygenase-like cupin family protein
MNTPARSAAKLLLILTLTLAWSTTSVARQDGTSGATPEPTPGVTREVLSEADPESAPGEVLALVRYVIPAGVVLPVHTHPGIQMATVESGTLTYHVIAEGSITVTRADGTVEEIGPGETVELTAGDAWVEPEGMVHYAENLTEGDVVLMATSLLEADEPASIVVSATPKASPVATPVS